MVLLVHPIFLVDFVTRKTSTSVWSICTTSSGRDAAYSPAHALCGFERALRVFALQSDRPPIDAIDARLDRPAVRKR